MLQILYETPVALVVASERGLDTTTISRAEVLEAVSQAGAYVDSGMTMPELLDHFPGETMVAVYTLLGGSHCHDPSGAVTT